MFHAVLGNFNTAISATETALNSAGSAARENEAYMTGLESKVLALKQAFQELSTSLLDSEVAGVILDSTASLLRLVNTDVGRIAAIGTAVTAVTIALAGLWNAVNKGGRLFAVFTKGAPAVLGALTPLGVALVGIITTLTLLIAFAPQIKNFFDRISDPIGNATKKLEENNAALQSARDRLRELEATPWHDRTPEISKEIGELRQYIATLEEANKKLDARRAKAAYSEVNQSKRVDVSRGYQQVVAGNGGEIFDTAQQVLDNIAKTRGEVYETVEEAKKAGILITEVFVNVSQTAEEYYGIIVEEQKKFNEQIQNGQELTDEEAAKWNVNNDILVKFVDTMSLASKHSKDLSKDLIQTGKDASKTVKDFGLLNEQVLEHERVQKIAANGIKITEDAAKSFTVANKNLSSSIGELNGQFYIERDALYSLAAAGNHAAQSLIRSQADATRAALENTKTRIKALIAEQKAMNFLPLFILKGVEKVQTGALEGLLAQIDSWGPTTGGGGGGGGGRTGGGGGGGGSASSTKPSVLEATKTLLEQLTHEIFLLNQQNAEVNAEAVIAIYTKMQDIVNKKANELRKQGYKDTSEEIIELQKLWWGYSDEIKKVYDQIAETQKKHLEESQEAFREYLEEQKRGYEALADEQRQLADEANKEANNYKLYAQFVKESIDEKIQSYRDEITALEQANEERQKEIALQEKLNNLAKAKDARVMVYKDGRFQYVSDIDAVSVAQSELTQYRRDRQLEKEKQYWQDKINELEKYKSEWNDFTKDYERNANLQLLIQSNLFTNEDLIFSNRINSAQNFAAKYAEAMNKALEAAKRMEEYQAQADAISTQISNVGGGGGGSGTGGGGGSGADWSQMWRDVDAAEKAGKISSDAAKALKDQYHENKKAEMAQKGVGYDSYNPSTGTWSYATGTLSAQGGLSLVGEQGAEFRVLNQGDGIIPADITKNLWSLGTNPYAYMSNALKNLNTSSSKSIMYQFAIDKLQLPSVSDAGGLVDGLRRYAHQYSTQRS